MHIIVMRCFYAYLDMALTHGEICDHLLLGHNDITLTTNIYAHLDMSWKKNIADSIAGTFGEKCLDKTRDLRYNILSMKITRD